MESTALSRFPDDIRKALAARVRPCTFARGHHLVVPGQVQREMYFVEEGVQMAHFEGQRKTHVMAFTYPPDPCALPESFSLQKESGSFLTCLTDSRLFALGFEELEEIFNQIPTAERFFRKMTEAVLAGMISRHLELHSLSMEERYLTFCRRSPHLLQLVPHKYLASYLGMDATNFSKLYNGVKF